MSFPLQFRKRVDILIPGAFPLFLSALMKKMRENRRNF